MPIEVRHEPPSSMAALAGLLGGMGRGAESELESRRQAGRLAVQLDAQQTQQATHLNAQREAQMRQIEAQSNLQREAADTAYARTALATGLQGKLQEQQFDHEFARMQAEAKAKADQWEFEFSAKQRQEIARFNEAKQSIANNDSFTPEEKATATRLIDLQQANIQPAMIPRDPSKPNFPEGKGPMDTWVNEQTGGLMGLDRSLNPRVLTQPKDMPDFLKERDRIAQENKVLELQAKREEKLLDLRKELATEDIIETGADGKPKRRQRTSEEVSSIMDTVLGTTQQVAEDAPWWRKVEEGGVKVTDSDKQLPPNVGYAQAYIRDLNKRYGGLASVPEDQQAAYVEAARILQQYAGAI